MELKVKYLNSFDEYDKLNYKLHLSYNEFDYEILKKPLYHGTRKFMLDMGELERLEMKRHCDIVLSFMRDNYNSIDQDKIKEYIEKTGNDFYWSPVILYNHTNYKYDGFYFTTSYFRAIDYSRNVFGEMGEYAYHCAQAIIDMNLFTNNSQVRNSAEYIQKEYMKYMNSERIILVINNINILDLVNESGELVNRDYKLGENINLLRYKIEVDKIYFTNETCIMNFKVNNIENYTLYAIPQNLIRQGITYFRRIKNVDEY